jgi:uncharacterized protein YecA (UPF0149 family)
MSEEVAERVDWINKDAAKAKQILKEGLATPGVVDRSFMLERLAELYEETGRTEEAETVRAEIKQLQTSQNEVSTPPATMLQVQQGEGVRHEGLAVERSLDWEESSLAASLAPPDSLLRPSRVGRNEPCPCGSGKKFKKCCGKRA